MSIRTKLYSAFIIMIALAFVIGGVSLYAFTRTQKMIEEAKQQVAYISDSLVPASVSLASLSTDATAAGMNFYAYTFNSDDTDLNAGLSRLDACDASVKSLEAILAATSAERLVTTRRELPKIKDMLRDIRGKTDDLRTSVRGLDTYKERVEVQVRNMDSIMNELLDEAMGSIKDAIISESKDGLTELPPLLQRRTGRAEYLDEIGDAMTRGQMEFRLGQSLFGDRAEAQYQKAIATLKDVADNVTGYANDPDRIGRRLETKQAYLGLAAEINGYVDSINAFSRAYKTTDGINGQIAAVSQQLLTVSDGLSDYNSGNMIELTGNLSGATANIDTLVDRSALICWLVVAFSILAGALCAVFITRSVTRPINQVIRDLALAESDIVKATAEISEASQSLAEGVTEQAASLEQTSAAMEEMASMTRQSADHAQHTREITARTSAAVETGAEAMDEMGRAMVDISESSDKVQNVIKTISDIAFQTNLLALNAAVEAARAGEAGKGFAVVADEVRNLSQRSAQAVRDTESLIQNTVQSVQHGNAITGRLTDSFREIREGTLSIGNTIDGIADAAQESAQGVDQVNNSVAMMDKVTQQNASAASATADASSTLGDQVGNLHQNIGELLRVVHGVKAAADPAQMARLTRSDGRGGVARRLPALARNGAARVMRPDMVVPLDED